MPERKRKRKKKRKKKCKIRGNNMFFSRPAGNRFYDRGDFDLLDWTVTGLTADNTWYELDLSPIVGLGRRLVLFALYINDTVGGKKIYFRTKGNINDRNIASCHTQVANKTCSHGLWIYTDINGKIEYLADTATWNAISITIRGWFK